MVTFIISVFLNLIFCGLFSYNNVANIVSPDIIDSMVIVFAVLHTYFHMSTFHISFRLGLECVKKPRLFSVLYCALNYLIVALPSVIVFFGEYESAFLIIVAVELLFILILHIIHIVYAYREYSY